jgi:hypothetical protein
MQHERDMKAARQMKRKAAAAKLRSWRVIIMRSKGEHIGTVEAPDRERAEAVGHQAARPGPGPVEAAPDQRAAIAGQRGRRACYPTPNSASLSQAQDTLLLYARPSSPAATKQAYTSQMKDFDARTGQVR